MSASTLLVDGKIRSSLLPPTNPNLDVQSVSIEAIPSSGGGSGDAILGLRNADGDDAFIIKGGGGSLIIQQEAESVFAVSANNLAIEIGNTTVQQLEIFSSTTLNIDCPVINLGNSTEADPLIQVVGTGATGRVYDDHFNPVNKAPEELGSGVISIAGGFNVETFPCPLTGLYNFNLSLTVDDASVIGTGCIVINATDGATGPIVPALSTTITPTSLVSSAGSGGASTPIYFNYSFLAYLTANDDYYFRIIPVGSGWAGIDYTLNVVQMC
jgi:hypothetical protein